MRVGVRKSTGFASTQHQLKPTHIHGPIKLIISCYNKLRHDDIHYRKLHHQKKEIKCIGKRIKRSSYIFDQPPSPITPTLNRVSEMGSGLIQWTVFCRVAMGRRCSTRTGVCWLMTNSFCSVSLERSSGVTGPLRLCTSAVYDLVLSSSPLFRCAVCSLWSDQVRSGQVRSGQVRSDQVRSGQCPKMCRFGWKITPSG